MKICQEQQLVGREGPMMLVSENLEAGELAQGGGDGAGEMVVGGKEAEGRREGVRP
jgi:hypothetical protein